MAKKQVERRAAELREPLPESYVGTGDRKSQGKGAPIRLFDAETGFYTRPALAEFIQYEIDGSAQTMLNELYVTPLCLAAVSFDIDGAPGKDERAAAVAVVSDAIRKLTRVADRAARDEERFLLLLRRTLAANVRDHFAPRLVETVNGALIEMGVSG